MTSAAASSEDRSVPAIPQDLRLVLPALAAWLAAFATLWTRDTVAYALAAAAGVVGTALLLWRANVPAGSAARRRAVATALICAAAAAAGTGLRLSAVGSSPVRALAADHAGVSLEAVVTTDPQVRHGQRGQIVVVRARAEAVRSGDRLIEVRVPVVVLARGRAWQGLLPSQRIRFTARLTPPKRGELLAAVALVRGPPAILGDPSSMQRAAGAVRVTLREATGSLPADQRAVLPGLVLGDTSRLDPELTEQFRTAGLSHLMVVSGANLALIIGAVLGLARFAGLGRRAGPLSAAVVMLAFVVVVRPEPSVLRATIMAAIGLLALISGRERRGLPALGAAVLALVLIDPELARSYGFVLSVLATAGLLVLAPPWRERLSRRMPRPLAEVFAVSAAAQVACAPVLAMLFGQVGLAAIPANLLAAPAVAPATVLGALAALVAPFVMPLARLIVVPAGLAVGWIVGIARTAAAVPYATVPWPAGATGAALLVAAGVLVVLVVRRRPLRRWGTAAAAGVLVVVIGARIIVPGWPPRGWQLVACDIGQGDAVVLAAGAGQAVVVDAGPDPRLVDRCLRDLSIRTVPLLVLTHPHADHIAGIPGVLRGRTVGTVLLSPGSSGEELRLVRGGDVRPTTRGEVWTAGSVRVTVLGPPPGGSRVAAHDDGTTVNNTSIVLVAQLPDVTVLLSGDVEEEAQRALAASVPPVDVLKVPHHGSARQDPGFIAASRARIAITSVGGDNTYGHPAPATLALLERLGMRGYRTDHDGDIAVVRTGTGLGVIGRGPVMRR